MSLSSHSVMDCSRLTQSLDSLWFYTNILTCIDGQVAASFTDQRDSQERFTVTKANDAPSLLNQQNDQHQNVESMIPRCTKCGGVSTAFEAERYISKSNNSDVQQSGRERDKKETRKRRKRNNYRSGLHGMKVILGGLDLGFGVKGVNGFLRFEESCGYDQIPAVQEQITKIPPLDVAMKEHLKLWAYAVACTV